LDILQFIIFDVETSFLARWEHIDWLIMVWQTDEQTDRQTDRWQTDRQTDRVAFRSTSNDAR